MKRLALTTGLALALLATSSAAGSTSLFGSYQTNINPNFIIGGIRHLPMNAFGGRWRKLIGKWTITFTGSGFAWKHNSKGGVVDGGIYKISGSTITFRDTSAARGGIGCDRPGKYHFLLTGGKLKFSVISDSSNSCHGRYLLLTYHPFTKV